jgi:hypothetical protein
VHQVGHWLRLIGILSGNIIAIGGPSVHSSLHSSLRDVSPLKLVQTTVIGVRLSFVFLFVYHRFYSYISCISFNYWMDINENFENL